MRIIPSRGEYFQLTSAVSHMVRGLIYPIPDPDLLFHGVHLTRMVSVKVRAGPNAVLAFAKEGYRRNEVVRRELSAIVCHKGFLKFASLNAGTGIREIARSVLPQLFARDLRKPVPGIERHHLKLSPSGVRAQAISDNEKLVDDFATAEAARHVHILRAPSPAATASFAIAEYVKALAFQLLAI